GSGNRITASFPCTQALGLISCTPPQPVVKPSYIFVDFGPAPGTATPARAIAVGTNGKAQISTFAFPGGQPTTDLGLSGKLFQVTPRGLVAPRQVGGSWILGSGQTYGFDFQLADYAASPAPNASLRIALPPDFKLLGSYPTSCKQSGSSLD